MIRKIIQIDEEKCNGCGLCAQACHESAIGIINGKAKLLRDDYCDGLGDCLPACPAGAIQFVEREAAAYDEQAVLENKKKGKTPHTLECGCPGTHSKLLKREESSAKAMADFASTAGIFSAAQPVIPSSGQTASAARSDSMLRQWPIQIKLVPANAPYFDGADILIAADCTAYAYANLHTDFMRGRITLIGCPKLDNVDYTEKLTQIICENNIKSVTVVRMEVPCCGGIEHAVKNALKAAALHEGGKLIPWQVATISTDGKII